jgi:hypothetical protein
VTEDHVSFEHLRDTIGRVIVGEPFSLSDEDIDHFHRATWLDKAYPEGSVPEFPDTLIEGLHLLSMVDAVARFGVGGGGGAARRRCPTPCHEVQGQAVITGRARSIADLVACWR